MYSSSVMIPESTCFTWGAGAFLGSTFSLDEGGFFDDAWDDVVATFCYCSCSAFISSMAFSCRIFKYELLFEIIISKGIVWNGIFEFGNICMI